MHTRCMHVTEFFELCFDQNISSSMMLHLFLFYGDGGKIYTRSAPKFYSDGYRSVMNQTNF